MQRKGRKTPVSVNTGLPHPSLRLELPEVREGGHPTRTKQASWDASQGRGGLVSSRRVALLLVPGLRSIRSGRAIIRMHGSLELAWHRGNQNSRETAYF